METFGQRIRRLRREIGITQVKLAELVEVSKGVISFWENDINEPKASYIPKLAKALEVPIDYLFGVDPEYTPPYIPPKRANELTEELPPEYKELADTFLRFLAEQGNKS